LQKIKFSTKVNIYEANQIDYQSGIVGVIR